jgi:hypothetical protein
MRNFLMNYHPLIAAWQLYKSYYTAIGENVLIPPDLENLLLEGGRISLDAIQGVLDNYHEISMENPSGPEQFTQPEGLEPLGANLDNSPSRLSEVLSTPEKPGKAMARVTKALTKQSEETNQSLWTYDMAWAALRARATEETEKEPEQSYSDRTDILCLEYMASWVEDRRQDAYAQGRSDEKNAPCANDMDKESLIITTANWLLEWLSPNPLPHKPRQLTLHAEADRKLHDILKSACKDMLMKKPIGCNSSESIPHKVWPEDHD